jgi:hypothetical protein
MTTVINQYFPLGSHARRRFDELAAKCDAEILFSLSLIVCEVAYWPKRSIYDTYGTIASEVKELPDELEELAGKIDRTNDFLSSFRSAVVIDNDQAPIKERERERHKSAIYKHLPRTLRVFAADMRTAFEWINPQFGPKRYDSLRANVLELLQYVDRSTGSPHYEHLADILGHLFPSVLQRRGRDQNRETPALLNSDAALKQLYLRSSRRGVAPRSRAPRRRSGARPKSPRSR